MPDRKTAIINISKALMQVSFPTIAAIGSATGLPLLAGVTALPAAFTASEALGTLLEKHQDEQLELPPPPSWTRSAQDWQNVCSVLEQTLPQILDTVATELKQTQDLPTDVRLRQVLTHAIEQALPEWEVPKQERGLVAAYVAPRITEKALEVLKPLRDEVRMNLLSEQIEAIAEMTTQVFDQLNATQQAPLPPSGPPPSSTTSTSDTSAIAALLEQKLSSDAYDVYMCYHEADEDEAFVIGDALKARGILPWFDVLARPGTLRRKEQEHFITTLPSAAILVGQHGITQWQELQMYALLEQFVTRKDFPLIPVLLKSAPAVSTLPPFLATITWVDYHRSRPEPLGQLLWGITGERPEH